MKLRNIAKWAALFPALALGIHSNAFAHKVVHVQGTLYVIICEPSGSAFTFNGSAGGAGDVAGLMCPKANLNSTGGTTAGTIEVVEARPVPEAMLRQGASGATRKDCPSGTHWYEPAKACVANGGHPG